MQSRNQGNYRNPCLTMHQPWASLLVYGIKCIEGRSWPAPIRGCIEVVGCVQADELAGWNVLPEGVRLEAQTDYCWLCEQPLMRGYQKIYNLKKKIYEAAARVLTIVGSPPPVNFPLPNPRDLFSLKPGSLLLHVSKSEQSEPGKSSSLSAAVAGAPKS